jgi:hypothetical protein
VIVAGGKGEGEGGEGRGRGGERGESSAGEVGLLRPFLSKRTWQLRGIVLQVFPVPRRGVTLPRA